MRGIFIAVEGSTGVGKTSVATGLAGALDALVMFDPFEANPFLPQLLVGDHPGDELALRVELTFLALRIAQLREISRLLDDGRDVVADWALFKQPIFAHTTLDPMDAASVAATVALWADRVPAPDLLIGLSASTSTLRRRVRRRGRAMESALTGAQLTALSAAFETAYAQLPGPLIRLDAGTFDVFNQQHLSNLAAEVRQVLSLGSCDDTTRA